MDSNHYFSNEEMQSQLEEWAQSYPDLLRVEHLGNSYEGRPILLAILTRQDNGVDHQKPAVWVDANIHATEITGTTTALRLLEQKVAVHENGNWIDKGDPAHDLEEAFNAGSFASFVTRD